MQSAFGTVVIVVSVLGIIGAIAALVFSGRTWDEYGKNHLLMDSDARAAGPRAAVGGSRERDMEIRQLLEARNARRRRRGEPEIDIDAELARLTAPIDDPELRQEIRDMVLARNHRRARQGKPPLDVEAEIERQIASLSEL